MTLFIGADHRGFQFKKKLITKLQNEGYRCMDTGAFNEKESSDYPVFAFDVSKRVAAAKKTRGILICMTGIGNAIAANKVCGIRAALCYNEEAARLSRAHNDANVLVLPAKFVSFSKALKICKAWLKASFEGGRHARRVNMIKRYEKSKTKRK